MSLHGAESRVVANPTRDGPNGATMSPQRPTLDVAGEGYMTSGDATLTVLEASGGTLTPSGAYGRLNRATRAGAIRTHAMSRTVRLYHARDVLTFADGLRDA